MPETNDRKATTDKAVHDMTVGELKEFVRARGEQIGIEVTRTETANTTFTRIPRT